MCHGSDLVGQVLYAEVQKTQEGWVSVFYKARSPATDLVALMAVLSLRVHCSKNGLVIAGQFSLINFLATFFSCLVRTQ